METIVPFRLKVNLTLGKKKLDYTDKFLECRIETSYLFGAPASGLETSLELRLTHREQHFASFPGFSFNNEAIPFQEVKETSFEGTLDQKGAVAFRIKLPSFRGAPSALDLILKAGTVEKGGREVTRREMLPVISLPSASEGSLLVTVEKGNNILSAEWHPLEKGETNITIPITKEMLPTAYVTVSFIQPYRQQSNDRPIRMYGIVALKVEDPATRQELEIIASERFRPNQDFTVTLQTGDKKPTRFTLAVVDQGLLALTAFKTPDPWSEFYRKQRLAVSTYDLFNDVIGAHKGDVFRNFSIGGSEGILMVDEDSDSGRIKRFVPVVFATEPAMTDKKGRARISFKMPNYMGAVRIMAVTAQGCRYSHAEKSVPVSSDLVILPTLPRILGPD